MKVQLDEFDDPDIPPLVHTSAIVAASDVDAPTITSARRRLPKTPPPQINVAAPARAPLMSPNALDSSFGDEDDDDVGDVGDVDALSTEREDVDVMMESKTSAGVSPLSTPVFGGSRAPSTSPTRKMKETTLKSVDEMQIEHAVPDTKNRLPMSDATRATAEKGLPNFDHRFSSNDLSSDDDDSYPLLGSNPLFPSALNPDLAQMYGYNNNNFSMTGAGEGNCDTAKNDVSVTSNSSRHAPSDPTPILDALHQQTEALAKERGAKEASHSKIKILERQIQALKKQMEEVVRARAELEERLSSKENELQQSKYRVEEEAQLRKNAESLQKTLRDQLTERHNQYGTEMEVKQTLEMSVRDATLQLASAEANLHHVEMERDQLSRELSVERDARFELEKKVKDLECKLLSLREESTDKNSAVMDKLQEASRCKLEAEAKFTKYAPFHSRLLVLTHLFMPPDLMFSRRGLRR